MTPNHAPQGWPLRALAALLAHPRWIVLPTLVVLLLGLLAIQAMPVATMPEIEFPTIVVDAQLPGASAETVSATLATPLERALDHLPYLASLTSNSTLGATQLVLRFDLSRPLDLAALDVQGALASAASDLPRDLPAPPQFAKRNPTVGSVIFLSLHSQVLTMEQVSAIVDKTVRPMLRGVPGVGEVVAYGARRAALDVTVDPERLAAHALTLEDIRTAVAANSAERPKGLFDTASRRTIIASDDRLATPAQFMDIPVARRDDAVVRLGDVARVSPGTEDRTSLGQVNGKPAVLLGVRRLPGANTLATVEGVRALEPALRQALPPTVELDYVADRSISVRASLRDVRHTLLLTIALVCLVTLAFLKNLRAALVAAMVIPVSLLGTCAVIRVLGFSLNNVSLIALTICIGLVVDDALVVIEKVIALRDAGRSARDAILEGLADVGFTLLAITACLVAAFIPLLFMDGLTGRLLREFSVTLAVAVTISGLASVTLTPLLCQVALGPQSPHAPAAGRAVRAYAASLRWTLARPLLVLGLLLATGGGAATLYASMGKGFFPAQDTRQVNGGLVPPPDASPAQMQARMQVAAALLAHDPAVANVVPMISDTEVGFLIDLVPEPGVGGSSADYIARMKAAARRVPGLALFLQVRPELSLGSVTGRSQYEYRISGRSLEALRDWVPRLAERMRAIRDLRGVAIEGLDTARVRRFDIDRTRAAAAGVSVQQVDDVLDDAFGARRIAQLHTVADQVPVMLRLPDGRQDEATLPALMVRGDDGHVLPLATLLTPSTGTGMVTIRHDELQPSASIVFDLVPGASLDAALDAIAAAQDSLARPEGLRTQFVGSANEFKTTLQKEPALVAVAVAGVWLILGLLYRSVVHPLVILSTILPAGIGALLTLDALHLPLDMMGFVGILLLLGIVMKNAILVVDQALRLRRESPHAPAAEIAVAAAVGRLRPILMTTVAAAAGAMPLAFDSGFGSELRRPLGIVILGGLLASQLITLYSIPVMVAALDGWRARFVPRWRWRRGLAAG